jgi:glycosyltransferase involved in cell wall biosynthesis
VLDVDMASPLPAIDSGTTEAGVPFGRAWVLARIHGWPLGFVELQVPEAGVPAEALAAAVRSSVGEQLAGHLANDGLPIELDGLAAGVGIDPQPACLADRRAVLEAPPSVSIVVPTVDRPEALRGCLESLLDQTYPDFEIVVVDNAPGESGAADVVAAFGGASRIRLVAEPRRGASRARNRGLRAASGEIVAFLDGDVRADRSWLAASVTALVTPVDRSLGAGDGAEPGAASAPAGPGPAAAPSCVTGAILPLALDTEARLWMEEWGGYAKGFERRAFDLGPHRPDGPLFPYAIAACGSGASMLFRRRDVLARGGFDPLLGGGAPARSGEDLALLLDVVADGGTVLYEPGAIVWHGHPATEERFRAVLRDYGVGLTAYLTRDILRRPVDALRIAARLPAAAAYFARPSSGRNHRRSATFPRDVWRDELVGMVRGPGAYLLGLLRLRRLRRHGRPTARAGARELLP